MYHVMFELGFGYFVVGDSELDLILADAEGMDANGIKWVKGGFKTLKEAERYAETLTNGGI